MRLGELVRRSDAAKALPGASPDVEVERSVSERLYGNRAGITATPIPHGAAPPGRLVGGRYRLVERLGAGGMATVYRARDEQLEREVAVKVIGERHARDPLVVRRFRSEAQLGARLAHSNIVAVLDAGAHPRDFIVTGSCADSTPRRCCAGAGGWRRARPSTSSCRSAMPWRMRTHAT